VPVFPGLWDQDDTPTQVYNIMSGWHNECGIIGGFMWLYDDFVGNGLAAQYASAINNAVGAPGFIIAGSSEVFLNQSSTGHALFKIKDLNGFNGRVTLSLSALPKGVQSEIKQKGNEAEILFKASPTATTGYADITVTGISGTITQTFPFTLAVSAGVGTYGKGTPVDLSSAFNLYGIYTDGSVYTTGGLDGDGYSYSATLLTGSRVLDRYQFNFGPANGLDAIGSSGQSIVLPVDQFSGLALLASGIEGNQESQTITVTYTDGTTSTFRQSFSDWYTPQNFPGEYEAVAMAYRNYENGTEDKRLFNLYGYLFVLNPSKTVQSLTLPNNSHVAVLAATLLQ